MNFIKNTYTKYDIKLRDISFKKHSKIVITLASILLAMCVVIMSWGNYIAIGYLMFAMIYGVLFIVNDLKIEYTIIICFPFFLLYAGLIDIAWKRTPYSGNDPMIIRKIKLKRLIRKSRWNKLKVWKRL